MKRSLKTLLNYAEQHAEYVEDLDQLVVCFAPSSDMRCLLLLDGVGKKPSDEMWQSLLNAESVEEATSRAHDSQSSVAQLSDCSYENVFKLPTLPCELPCSDEEVSEDVQSENSLNPKRIKTNDCIVVENRMDCSIHNADQDNQPLLIANVDQHAIECTILHHCDNSNNAELDEYSHTENNRGTVCNSIQNDGNDKGSETGESNGGKVEVSCSDSTQTLTVMALPITTLHRDAEIITGLSSNPPIPVNSLPQQQYRPLQNRAPPASTYIPDIQPLSTVQLSYHQFQEIQQKERLDRSMKEKTAAASSKGVMQNGNYNNNSNSSNIMNNNSNSNFNSNIMNNSSKHLSTNSFSAQQSSPAAGVDSRNLLGVDTGNLLGVTTNCLISNHLPDQSTHTSMRSAEKADNQAEQGISQIIALMSDTASSEESSRCASRVDQQDPLRFSEWPSWIWSRTFCYPLPSTAVIAGN